jgi:hypothetical protein
MTETIVAINFTCAIISAKWALDLGCTQFRQILFLLGGLLLGPWILILLYVDLVRKAKAGGARGGKTF